ncbi:histidine-type phosphatase [Caulobacter sp. BK020]|uniref:histidine-type phosphatase n=1 Tax=Caulobacter sp. BK020 TaxID=2512117 RepID=UPI00104C6CEE|nr:histidine-type phosphatase [Caulobacter sp. BK020]TCS12241.1 4-phytase/acid phosphatase [Caulobacter sp. BK020]
MKPFLSIFACAAVLALGGVAAAQDPGPSGPLKVERTVMLYRHGVRAPLPGEAAVDAYAHPPWPVWSTPPSLLTSHGREAARLMGAYDRQRLSSLGLTAPKGCPTSGAVAIWTNTAQRTIASGEAFAEGFAPGCGLAVGHQPRDTEDPLFHPLEAKAVEFKAADAVAAITAETGGPAALVAPYAGEIREMERVLGCDRAQPPCDIASARTGLEPSADGGGLVLDGPISVLSGTAQVFMLQYAEGLPLGQVGWGRATPRTLEDVSRLHALLFDIHARPRYMARRIGGPMARRISGILAAKDAPAVNIFVGHDNNIAALASLIGAHFKMDGYGQDDPPIGGALELQVLIDAQGRRFVAAYYEAQTPDQLRSLTPLSLANPPARRALTLTCQTPGQGPCRLEDFLAGLDRRLAAD